jgi:hypothetical protein
LVPLRIDLHVDVQLDTMQGWHRPSLCDSLAILLISKPISTRITLVTQAGIAHNSTFATTGVKHA